MQATQSRRRLSRQSLLTTSVIIFAVVVGSFVSKLMPGLNDLGSQPFVRHAAVGQTGEMRTGSVTVHDVRVGDALEGPGGKASTTGLWLVVDLDYTAKIEQQHLAKPTLRDAQGREFGGAQALNTICGPAQPGITLHCSVAIEIAKDALPGSTLVLPASLLARTNPDDVLEVDLGIDDDRAAQLTSGLGPVKVERASLEGGS